MAGRDNNEAFDGLHATMQILGPAIRAFAEIEKIMVKEVEEATKALRQELNNLLKAGPKAFVDGVQHKLTENYRKMQQDLNILSANGQSQLAFEISNGYDALHAKIKELCANTNQLSFGAIAELATGVASLQQMQKELRNDNTSFIQSRNPSLYGQTRHKIDVLLQNSPLHKSLSRINIALASQTQTNANNLAARFAAAQQAAAAYNANRTPQPTPTKQKTR